MFFHTPLCPAPQIRPSRNMIMENKERANKTGGVGLEQVGKARFDAGGLVEEREKTPGAGESGRDAHAVLPGLNLNANEGRTLLLDLDDSNCLAIYEEKVRPPNGVHGWVADPSFPNFRPGD